jgi:hypothetical protein
MSLKKVTASSSFWPKMASGSTAAEMGARPVGWKGSGREFSDGLLLELLVLG